MRNRAAVLPKPPLACPRREKLDVPVTFPRSDADSTRKISFRCRFISMSRSGRRAVLLTRDAPFRSLINFDSRYRAFYSAPPERQPPKINSLKYIPLANAARIKEESGIASESSPHLVKYRARIRSRARAVPFLQIFLATRILLAQVTRCTLFFPLPAVRVGARKYRTRRALFRERRNNAR